MSLIRPEVKAAFIRWREAVAGVAVAALGLRWAMQSGLLMMAGILVALAGLAVVYVGVQRGRFRGPGGGPGVVQLVEGQLGYFGPETGGVISVDEIRAVSREADLWIIEDGAGARLEIPVDARGAECLLDAFAMLPGLDMHAVVNSVDGRTGDLRRLWRRPRQRLH